MIPIMRYTEDVWFDWTRNFLSASATLSGHHTDLDNHDEKKGYYGALYNAVKQGMDKQQLGVDQTVHWAEMIGEEQRMEPTFDRKEIEQLIGSLEARIQKSIGNIDDEVALLGDICYEVETTDLYGSLSREMSHLLMNYVAARFDRPVIIFDASQKKEYEEAVHNKYAMRLIVAEKIRTAVFYGNTLMVRESIGDSTDKYKPLVPGKRGLLVEWHQLLKAAEDWASNK